MEQDRQIAEASVIGWMHGPYGTTGNLGIQIHPPNMEW